MTELPTLRRGDDDEENVKRLQAYLQQSGHYKGRVDGLFGPNTERAVIKFQKTNRLLVDGIVGRRTWRRLMRSPQAFPEATSKDLTEEGLSQAARDLDIPVAALKAFAEVESAGDGFLADGRAKILFEQHWMYRLLKQAYGLARADELHASHEEVVNPKPGNYAGGTGAWDRFNLAAQLDRDCAIQSCSYGRFQLMGFHWQALGYSSPEQFFNTMMASEDAQLKAIGRFIRADRRLHQAIKDQDWAEVAYRYNGKNYHINQYDTKLAAAFERYQALG